MSRYFLRKSKKILFHTYNLFKRKRKKLPLNEVKEIAQTLDSLQHAVIDKNREKASEEAKKCEGFCRTYLRKGTFENFRDLIFALAFALFVALLIRQIWFELYEIPSGSMRPTFKEKDRLVVSKADFGINFPFTPGHFYFNPDLLKRAGTFVFTVENMPVRDPDTLYFYLFPGKKQFVKRLMGKAGDILYFYGGNVYGIDKEGRVIFDELQPEKLSKIDHIPFVHFDGTHAELSDPLALPTGTLYRSATIYQMNQPLARLRMLGDSRFSGEMLPHSAIAPSSFEVKDFGDLWGINNYATARLLSKDQIKTFYSKDQVPTGDALAYLELKHHPSLASLKLIKDPYGRIRPNFKLSTSFIPLNEEHLKRLFSNLYTSRFQVKNGVASSIYHKTEGGPSLFSNVPDGIYEFFYGKAYELVFDGVAKELPIDHPLYQFTPERVGYFFNFGIDFEPRYFSDFTGEIFLTSRYSYYRKGDLFVMGAPILLKDDPALIEFIQHETAAKTTSNLYQPFLDSGEPDIETIKNYGLKIPEKSYLALGDNYANSSDSRDFGFVPQDNIRGGPYFIFWPPGDRFGHPNQAPYATFIFPRMVIWILAAICFGLWYAYHRKRTRLPLDLSQK